jgi:hypothetical protein
MNPFRTVLAGLVLAVPFGAVAETSVEAQVHAASAIPPAGSYTQSCTAITFNGPTQTISAQCNRSSGGQSGTQLVITPCGSADIANINGQLRCETGTPPAGPYRTQCADAWVYGTELRAYCKRTPLSPLLYNSLAYASCKGPISVVGAGHLSCDQGIAIPNGSYKQSCEVAAYAWQGVIDSLFMDCKKLDGSWNWNQLSQPAKCTGDIWNDEGIPKCNRGGLPPAGSYTQSCTKPLRDNDVLFATCRISGNPLPVVTGRLASIKACNGADIFNESGALKCIPAAAAPPPPPRAAPPPPPPPAPTPTITKQLPKTIPTLLPPPPQVIK